MVIERKMDRKVSDRRWKDKGLVVLGRRDVDPFKPATSLGPEEGIHGTFVLSKVDGITANFEVGRNQERSLGPNAVKGYAEREPFEVGKQAKERREGLGRGFEEIPIAIRTDHEGSSLGLEVRRE